MKNSGINLGEKNRSSIATSLLGQGFMFGCYDGLASITDKLGLAADMAIVGTTAGVDANAGWFTGNGSGHYEAKAVAYIDSVMRLDDDSQLIIAFDYLTTAAAPYPFSYGRITSATGGYSVIDLNNNAFRFDFRAVGSGSSKTLSSSNVSLQDGNKHHILIDIDTVVGSATLYVDGVVDTASVHADYKNGVGVEATGGLIIGARFGATAVDKQLASTSKMANFFAFKPSVISSTLAATIAAELAGKRHEIPWAIEGK